MTVKHTAYKQGFFSEATLRTFVLCIVLLLQNIAITSSGFAQVPEGVSIPKGYSFQQIICNPLASEDGSEKSNLCGDCAPCTPHVYITAETALAAASHTDIAAFRFSITRLDVLEHYGFFRFSRAPPRV